MLPAPAPTSPAARGPAITSPIPGTTIVEPSAITAASVAVTTPPRAPPRARPSMDLSPIWVLTSVDP